VTKDFYDTVHQQGHACGYDGGAAEIPECTAMLRERTANWLADCCLDDKQGASILEIGCGIAFLSKIYPGWHGAEYSRAAVEQVRAREGSNTRII
jgi:hypothetical protein